MLPICNRVSDHTKDTPESSIKDLQSREHALIGVSTFNSYFSVENMEKLFLWGSMNFKIVNVFFMDEASIFNLMAIGYDRHKSLKKTKKHDRNLYNKIIKSFVNIGFDVDTAKEKILLLSTISKNQKYQELYDKFLLFFENNLAFKYDCLGATQAMLSEKTQQITEEALNLAVKYLLAELPLWFDTPYILGVESSAIVYKDLSPFWNNICYNYGLLSKNQSIFIKNVIFEDEN